MKEYLEPFSIKTYKPEPLENYKMVFYGDGKIVALEQTSMDVRLRGEGALWGLSNDEDENAYFHYRYLYLPEGKKLEDGLEVIR